MLLRSRCVSLNYLLSCAYIHTYTYTCNLAMAPKKSKIICNVSRRSLNWLETRRWLNIVDKIISPKCKNTSKWYKAYYVAVEDYYDGITRAKICKREKFIIEWNDGTMQEHRMTFLHNRGCRSGDREREGDRFMRNDDWRSPQASSPSPRYNAY